jgi:hypothetical protein
VTDTRLKPFAFVTINTDGSFVTDVTDAIIGRHSQHILPSSTADTDIPLPLASWFCLHCIVFNIRGINAVEIPYCPIGTIIAVTVAHLHYYFFFFLFSLDLYILFIFFFFKKKNKQLNN